MIDIAALEKADQTRERKERKKSAMDDRKELKPPKPPRPQKTGVTRKMMQPAPIPLARPFREYRSLVSPAVAKTAAALLSYLDPGITTEDKQDLILRVIGSDDIGAIMMTYMDRFDRTGGIVKALATVGAKMCETETVRLARTHANAQQHRPSMAAPAPVSDARAQLDPELEPHGQCESATLMVPP